VLTSPDDETVIGNIKGEVNEFMAGFSLYPEWHLTANSLHVPSQRTRTDNLLLK
jgi:hypothetical protein